MALIEDGVERPSDWSGVLYVPFDLAGAWKQRLASELANAEISFDLAKLLDIDLPATSS